MNLEPTCLPLFCLALLASPAAAGEPSPNHVSELAKLRLDTDGARPAAETLAIENAALRERIAEIEATLAALQAAQGARDDERIRRLEEENEELRNRIDAVAGELERFSLGSIAPPIGDSAYGFGPAASKIYNQEGGISLGGYGEAVYQNFAGDSRTDEFDFLRWILYVGYRFSERWIFNSEIELEHASTSNNGSVSVEFAYFDYLSSPALNFRFGMLLVPMGFVNELHEPVLFLSANRPMTETVLIPSTWRENGFGIFGDLSDTVSYRTYVVNGLDGTGFAAGGLRGGRQRGADAFAEDFAWVGRVDWTPSDEVIAGASAYYGDSGQNQTGVGGALPGVGTLIYEVHAQVQSGPWFFRGLAAMAELDDVTELNNALALTGTDSIGEELEGFYVEAGYDVMPLLDSESTQSLSPFVRFEAYDTQASVPAGFAADPTRDEDVVTMGLNWKPFSQLVFKLDYQDFDQGIDQWNLAFGWIY